jgi:hypothetical protein
VQKEIVVALATVFVVSGVPGFAQTNSAADRQRAYTSASVARAYVPVRTSDVEPVTLAPNITVTSVYRALVSRMLERSATFRNQCERLGRARHLTIEIKAEMSRRPETTRAWTNISRAADARLHAIVTVPPGTRQAELIAHELEHVLEQLDGVNLQDLSRIRSSGVRECQCDDTGAYETTRAIKTGLRVAEEVGEGGP